jgi:3-oxoacyl-[acyl-carrier protein] reductase
MRTIDLSGQTALVTGASSGIGRATAIALAEAGCDVAVHYNAGAAGAEMTAAAIAELGRRTLMLQGDFTASAAVDRVVQDAARALGGLDILVNNAGSLLRRIPLAEAGDAHWDAVIALNLSSVFWSCRAALPHLRRGARIVNVTSIAAHTGGERHSFPYAAAKGGVISLTRGLANELAPRGIRVNAISPGVIDTPLQARFSSPEGLAEQRHAIPLQRLGRAADCADAVLYLVSDLSDFLTGEIIEVNGGQHFA